MWIWEGVDVNNIKEIKLQLLDNADNGVFIIDKMDSGGDIWQDTALFMSNQFYPFVDEFGQYKHKDWKGKIIDKNNFKERAKQEEEELKKHQSNKSFDNFGGWNRGTKLKATGHFYTKKINGKWWFVTPKGHLFWSQGLNCVRYTHTITRVKGREIYFENLPDSTSHFADFFSGNKNSKGYNFAEANLFRKYGPNWQEISKQRLHHRLENWGINTIGNCLIQRYIRYRKHRIL